MHPAAHIPPDAPTAGLPQWRSVRSVVQPIVRLDDGMVIGYEALARVESDPVRPPDWWLEQAARHGRRAQLEESFLRSAARLGPPPGDALLFVNASPAALADPALFALRNELPDRLVLEITEQEAVDDYSVLKEQLAPWMHSKVRFAIDDAGAGYSSLRHVVELSPDFLKFDRSLVQNIDKDSHRHALVRALVAFAREIGTSVIAEGIETSAELAVLMAAGVTLGQGYLLGRPAEPWPVADESIRAPRPTDLGRDAGLRQALSKARTCEAACDAVVAYLFRLGQFMPSLYLERNGQLRCVAQRGLWQVLDGLPEDGGITGRVWATGESIEVSSVADHPHYLEAVPGVVAEICVPVRVDRRTVGSLNVDSLSPLPAGALRQLQDCATLLARRLSTLGWQAEDSPWLRAVHGSVAISEAATDRNATDGILSTLMGAAGMDSAGIIRMGPDGPRLQDAVGPLAGTLLEMDTGSLESVCHLIQRLSSCYTGQETTGLPYLGSEALRSGGARAVILLPLRVSNVAMGAIVLAHSRPMRLSAELVEPLELLAGQAAATLKVAELVEELRREAIQDGLTGLFNRAAFDAALDEAAEGPRAVIVADLDHFKLVNDLYGHPTGDEALRSLARCLTGALPGVRFFRMGGDEFTCLLTGSDATNAARLADQITRIGAGILAHWNTSLSVGVALSAGDETPHDTLIRADAALLWAKQHARGQAVVHPEPAPTPA